MRDTWVAGSQVITFYNPTKIIYGVGSIGKIVDELHRHDCKKPLLVSDHNIAGSGLLNNLIESLNTTDIQYDNFYDAVQELDSEQIMRCKYLSE